MTATRQEGARLVPRPLIRTFWMLHRAAYRVSGGRFGLSQPEAGERFGMMRLATVGRRSGKSRVAIVGYFEDGSNLVTVAMNGWGTTEPAWWLNLQSNPDATVTTAGGSRPVRARAATGAERERLWARIGDFPGWGADHDALAARRASETAVVILEPVALRPERGGERVDDVAAPRRVDKGGRRLRLRHLWIVPGLAVAVVANLESQRLGLGIVPLLAFGIAPDLPRLLGIGQPHRPGQMARRAILPFNLMHHPAPPVAVLGFALAGILPPVFYIGALAWLGHLVVGLGVGDRVRTPDGYLPPLMPAALRPTITPQPERSRS